MTLCVTLFLRAEFLEIIRRPKGSLRPSRRQRGATARTSSDTGCSARCKFIKRTAQRRQGGYKRERSPNIKGAWGKFGNTLFFSCAILSKENIKCMTAILTEICRPVWTSRSAHAADCRSPEQTLKHCIESAQCEYMSTLEETAAVLLGPAKLKAICLISEFGRGVLRSCTLESD